MPKNILFNLRYFFKYQVMMPLIPHTENAHIFFETISPGQEPDKENCPTEKC